MKMYEGVEVNFNLRAIRYGNKYLPLLNQTMFIQPRVINMWSFDEVFPFVMINFTKASVPLTIPLVRILECFFLGLSVHEKQAQ